MKTIAIVLALLVASGMAAQLIASPDVVQQSGDNVTLTWSGVGLENVTSADWIGVYSPIDAKDDMWVTVVPVTSSPTFMEGYGSINVSIINMRTPYIFKYFSTSGFNLEATSNIVNFNNINEPTQAHLSLTNSSSEMRAMWTTNNNNTIPVVRYGINMLDLNLYAVGVSRTYTATMMCGNNANITLPRGGFRDVGYIHDVVMTNLQPRTTYYYQYGNDVDGYSPITNFTSPPQLGPEETVSFIAYGDMGITPAPAAATTAFRTYQNMDQIDLVTHFGDIAYAFGSGLVWEEFMSLIEPVSKQIPYMVSIGNHEYDHIAGGQNDPSHAPGNGFRPTWGDYGDDSSGECAVPVFYRFHMPDETGLAPFWYSYQYGSVHFTVLSMEHNFTEGSEQYLWLQSDLNSVNRTLTPWLIVGFHRPMYFSELLQKKNQVIAGYMKDNLEEMFFNAKVDLVLAGHLHSYERTCPLYKEECVQGGITHALIGMAGFVLDTGIYPHPMPKWSVYHDVEFGYVKIDVENSTHLHFQYHHNVDNAIADDFYIIHE